MSSAEVRRRGLGWLENVPELVAFGADVDHVNERERELLREKQRLKRPRTVVNKV